MAHQSDSKPQRDAEQEIIKKVSKKLGYELKAGKVELTKGISVSLDGYNEAQKVLCEVYAHIGSTKGAQVHKIARDILKLISVEKVKKGKYTKIICFTNDEAAECLNNNSWLAYVAKINGIEPMVIHLGNSNRLKVIHAQRRQVMINKD